MDTATIVHSQPRITFRHADHSPALEARALELTHRLERYSDRIIGCRIVIEGPSTHHAHNPFIVSFEIVIPGGVIHATSASPAEERHADPYAALKDAFENARRQLMSFDRAD